MSVLGIFRNVIQANGASYSPTQVRGEMLSPFDMTPDFVKAKYGMPADFADFLQLLNGYN